MKLIRFPMSLVLIALVLLAIAVIAVMPVTVPGAVKDPHQESLQDYANWVAAQIAQYQVDVFYRHHGVVGEGGNAGMKCLTDNGSDAAFSQSNRLLHLISFCGGSMYDVTIARIIKGRGDFKNPQSQLFRAEEVQLPEHLLNASNEAKVEWYFRQLSQKWGGIRVRLQFGPQDIMFFAD